MNERIEKGGKKRASCHRVTERTYLPIINWSWTISYHRGWWWTFWKCSREKDPNVIITSSPSNTKPRCSHHTSLNREHAKVQQQGVVVVVCCVPPSIDRTLRHKRFVPCEQMTLCVDCTPLWVFSSSPHSKYLSNFWHWTSSEAIVLVMVRALKEGKEQVIQF